MKYTLKRILEKPFLHNKNNIVTQEKLNSRIEDKLQYATRIIENIDLGFVRCSYPDFKVIYMNQKSCNYIQKSYLKAELPSYFIGKNYIDYLPIDEKAKLIMEIENMIEKKDDSVFRHANYIIQGEETFFKIMYQPLFGLNNQVKEITIIYIDVTEEVKAKNKIEKTIKMRDELFVNVSHELKTPLNVIFSTNQLIEFYLRNDLFKDNKEKVFSGVSIIKKNCYKLTKLINNIIDSSKIDCGFLKLNLANENIVEIVEDSIQSVTEHIKSKGINIVFDTNTEEKIIACDAEKIERIILNLISNAIKFTNKDGYIFVNLIDKGNTVEISVEDTGIGIDKKNLNRIFERFHQVDKSLSRNTEGSGIGLNLVRSLVGMHGGKISADSNVDKGSVFKIELPAKTVEETESTVQTKPIDNKNDMINIEFSDI